MKWIFKYDESNQDTHLASIPVEDNHILSDDELETLPNGFMTPAKLVNGKLTSASLDESNQAAQDYLDKVGIKETSVTITEMQFKAFQTQIAAMNTQINTLTTQNVALQKMVTVQNTQIAAMKGSANNA